MQRDTVRILPLVFAVLSVGCENARAQAGVAPEVSIAWPDSSVRVTETLDIKIKVDAMSPTGSESHGRFEFEVVTSFPGKQTVVEVSADLLNWIALSTNQPSINTFTFTDVSPAVASNRFYRVRVPAQ